MKLNIGDRVRIRVRFASRNVWAHGRIVGEADGRWLAVEIYWAGDEWRDSPEPLVCAAVKTDIVEHEGRHVFSLPREDVRSKRKTT